MDVRCLVWILALDCEGVRGIYHGIYFFQFFFSALSWKNHLYTYTTKLFISSLPYVQYTVSLHQLPTPQLKESSSQGTNQLCKWPIIIALKIRRAVALFRPAIKMLMFPIVIGILDTLDRWERFVDLQGVLQIN